MNEEELERTYLAARLPDNLAASPSKEIFDIYLPTTEAHPVLRIRKAGSKMEMTKKEPIAEGDRSVQLEQTIPLTESEYTELSALPGKRVAKNRYYYEYAGTTYEIGVFVGDLLGLVLIDVEFKTVEVMRAFVMPDFCLAEVTQEKFLAGGELCGKKYSDIEEKLKAYNYQKII